MTCSPSQELQELSAHLPGSQGGRGCLGGPGAQGILGSPVQAAVIAAWIMTRL